MKEFIAISKALSDQSRVRILLALEGRELCVCQLVEFLGLAPSTVSKHMSILRQSGLVDLRKEGRWAYYRLVVNDASPTVSIALEWVSRTARSGSRASEDRSKLDEILKCDPEELCKRALAN